MIISSEDAIEMSGVETLHPGGLDLSRRIGELVSFSPSVRVLDVSSGKGIFACLYARQFGSEVTGIEINTRFVDKARKRAVDEGVADKVRFEIGDSRDLPFPDGMFDVAVNECAVGLTAIDAPQRVLDEMARVTRTGGTIVIHESTWLKTLSVQEKRAASLRLGTTPHTVEEWQAMLVSTGAFPNVVEDWSGIDNAMKIRPGHRWNPKKSLDLFTTSEKLKLVARLVFKYGPGPVLGLSRSAKDIARYATDGYLGYALIIASK